MAIDPVVLADPDRFMQLAIDAAHRAEEEGDLPIGAVAVVAGQVVASAGNRRAIDRDPLGHAELIVIAETAAILSEWRLSKVTIVVTLEPCPMCAGAMWASRIGGLVFGAYDLKAGATGSLYHLGSDPRLNHEYPVLGGVLAPRCAELLSSFFARRRADRDPDIG